MFIWLAFCIGVGVGVWFHAHVLSGKKPKTGPKHSDRDAAFHYTQRYLVEQYRVTCDYFPEGVHN